MRYVGQPVLYAGALIQAHLPQRCPWGWASHSCSVGHQAGPLSREVPRDQALAKAILERGESPEQQGNEKGTAASSCIAEPEGNLSKIDGWEGGGDERKGSPASISMTLAFTLVLLHVPPTALAAQLLCLCTLFTSSHPACPLNPGLFPGSALSSSRVPQLLLYPSAPPVSLRLSSTPSSSACP